MVRKLKRTFAGWAGWSEEGWVAICSEDVTAAVALAILGAVSLLAVHVVARATLAPVAVRIEAWDATVGNERHLHLQRRHRRRAFAKETTTTVVDDIDRGRLVAVANIRIAVAAQKLAPLLHHATQISFDLCLGQLSDVFVGLCGTNRALLID